jgi:putative hydrolase of the HAD superfamily
MNFSTIFFDLDDTLYPAACGLWLQIRARISRYMVERMGLPVDQAHVLQRQYFEQYGTTLRGLEAKHAVDTADFLAYVHAVPLRDYLQPDPQLRAVLQAIPARKFIFSNADVHHARRVTAALGLKGCFDGVVDVVAIAPYCKPMPESFAIALQLAGEPDPRRCVMIDDLPRTTQAAREQGLFSILYGKTEPHPEADAVLTDWSLLPDLLKNGRQ